MTVCNSRSKKEDILYSDAWNDITCDWVEITRNNPIIDRKSPNERIIREK